jgi:hypothetical protein
MPSKGALKVDLSQQEASSSGNPNQGAGSSSQPVAAEKTGGRDLPVVRNLPINITFQAASSSGIPPQGANSSDKPMEGGDLKLMASKIGRFYLEMAMWHAIAL